MSHSDTPAHLCAHHAQCLATVRCAHARGRRTAAVTGTCGCRLSVSCRCRLSLPSCGSTRIGSILIGRRLRLLSEDPRGAALRSDPGRGLALFKFRGAAPPLLLSSRAVAPHCQPNDVRCRSATEPHPAPWSTPAASPNGSLPVCITVLSVSLSQPIGGAWGPCLERSLPPARRRPRHITPRRDSEQPGAQPQWARDAAG